MKPWLKKTLLGVGGALGILVVGGAGFAYSQVSGFETSMAKVHGVPLPAITASKDPAVIERGRHVAEAMLGCSGSDCHGKDYAGGQPLVMGPVATLTGPNITPAGMLGVYSDGELARLLRNGVRKDGRSVQFMPSQDFSWLPDDELTAVISYLRTIEPVEKANGPIAIGTLGKVLDRQGKVVLDVARRIERLGDERAGAPSPTKEYGRFVARMCSGCHGEGLSGGPLPGVPAEIPPPPNLTPHESGLAGWSYEDFDTLMTTGKRKNGAQLHPFMPLENFKQMNETEKQALYDYFMSLAPAPYGDR